MVIHGCLVATQIGVLSERRHAVIIYEECFITYPKWVRLGFRKLTFPSIEPYKPFKDVACICVHFPLIFYILNNAMFFQYMPSSKPLSHLLIVIEGQ